MERRCSCTRREFLKSAGLVAGAGLVYQRFLVAEERALGAGLVQQIRAEAADAAVAVQKLPGNISVLIGSGGNIAVLAGRDGKLLVDAGIPASRSKIAEALAGISSDPITRLVNTHWHFDHTDGNEWLHSAGAVIIAHENTRKRLATTTRVDDWDFTFPSLPAGALPTEIFRVGKTLHVHGAMIQLQYYQPAHTDGDISVHFTDADVLHVGDTRWNGVYPFIDYSTGGSIDGTIRATKANLAKATLKTVIIPGHGPVGTRSQLVEYQDMLAAIRPRSLNSRSRASRLAKPWPRSRPHLTTQSGEASYHPISSPSSCISGYEKA